MHIKRIITSSKMRYKHGHKQGVINCDINMHIKRIITSYKIRYKQRVINCDINMYIKRIITNYKMRYKTGVIKLAKIQTASVTKIMSMIMYCKQYTTIPKRY